jgi:hypothetical protein
MQSPVNVIRQFLGGIVAEPGVADVDIEDRGILLEYRLPLPRHGSVRLAMSKGGRLGFIIHAISGGRPTLTVRFELKEIVLAHVLRKFLLLGDDVHALVVALFTCSISRPMHVMRIHDEVAKELLLNFGPGSNNTCTASTMPSFEHFINEGTGLIWTDAYTASKMWSQTTDANAAVQHAEWALRAWAAGAREAAATHVQSRFRGWMARRTHAWDPNTPLGRFYALREFAALLRAA